MADSRSRSLREMFANQFQADGDAYLFRAKLGAPAYRFSRDERDRLTNEFAQRMAWFALGAGILAAIILAGLVWAVVSEGADIPSGAFGLAAILFAAAYAFALSWLFKAPLRKLGGRPEAAAGLPKAEATRLRFQRLTWARLGSGLVFVPLLLWHVGATRALFVGWNLVWVAMAGAVLLVSAVQAIRKLRAEGFFATQSPTRRS